MEAEAEAVIFFIVEAEAEALEKSNASATLIITNLVVEAYPTKSLSSETASAT